MTKAHIDANQNLPVSSIDELFNYAEQLGMGDLHIKLDRGSQLQAIVALHNTYAGPALGGCRIIEYSSVVSALVDAVRLAQGMAYKSAICGVKHGGGKSVILKPKQLNDRSKLLQTFGRFLNDINGRYIAAIDSGTSTADMDIIATQTKHVVCTGQDGNPAPYTAIGVRRSIESAVKFALGRDDVSGLHIAIQGVGAVGLDLARQLHERGATLTVTDINPENIELACNELGAKAVGLTEIHAVDCDVYSPCALGATLNKDTIPHIKAKVIAGCANNQLAEPEDGDALKDRDILYAPDYVVNSGGLIYASSLYYDESEKTVLKKIDRIYEMLTKIFTRAAKKNLATSCIADTIAEEIIADSKPK